MNLTPQVITTTHSSRAPQFVDCLKTHCESGTSESLLETFNNDGLSNYLVVYIRLLTTGQLHEKSEEYLPFVEGLYKTMKEFCDKVIDILLERLENNVNTDERLLVTVFSPSRAGATSIKLRYFI